MPIIKSAKKRMKQAAKRRLKNSKQRSKMRTLIKKVKSLVEQDKIEEAKAVLPETVSYIDRTVKLNMIHKNKGDRIKSNLTKLVNKS